VNLSNDKRLIQAAQHGNLEAFDQLMRGFDWPVLRLAFRITGNQTAVWSIYYEAMRRMHVRLAASQPDCSLCLFAYELKHCQGLDLRTVSKALEITEEPREMYCFTPARN
jgi:hypothetical protein